MNQDQIKNLQKRIGVEPDGFWGRVSTKALQDHLTKLMPKPHPFPKTDQLSLTDFYGKAGDESKLVNLDVTGLGITYEGKPVKSIRCHMKISSRLFIALQEISKTCPHVLKNYGGCYNNRPMRGGSLPSLHARGSAIDLLPATNGLHDHYPTKSDMPIEALEAFAKQGFLSAGAAWSRDGMHNQATQ